MPAESEPHEAVWVCAPKNEETWPGCLDQAQSQFAQLVEAMRKFVRVRDVSELGIQPYDAWIRDYGPLFVHDVSGHIVGHDFVFSAWGGKYPAWERDDRVAGQMANRLGVPIRRHDVTLEGGAIEVNGHGLLLTTRSCLLNANRNALFSAAKIETKLRQALGIDRVIWLAGELAGDDTDGHVDTVARFLQPDLIAAVRAPRTHPDYDVLEKNWGVLKDLKLELLALPCPEPQFFDFPSDDLGPAERRPLPASYANFLISNGAVFVPTFGQSSDDVALHALEGALPDHTVLDIRCEHLAVGLGTIHCLTLSQPKNQSAYSRGENIKV